VLSYSVGLELNRVHSYTLCSISLFITNNLVKLNFGLYTELDVPTIPNNVTALPCGMQKFHPSKVIVFLPEVDGFDSHSIKQLLISEKLTLFHALRTCPVATVKVNVFKDDLLLRNYFMNVFNIVATFHK